MAASSPGGAPAASRPGVGQILKSYFYWTYPRGSFHYDVMVTLILLFIFITPRLWNYGDRLSKSAGPAHPIQVVANGNHGLILTVEDVDAKVPANAGQNVAKRALRKAIEPVTGDAVFIEHWETTLDGHGNRVWRVWVHH